MEMFKQLSLQDHIFSTHLEATDFLHDGQYGSRARRSTVDAAAVLMSRTQEACKRKAVAGALLVDIKY